MNTNVLMHSSNINKLKEYLTSLKNGKTPVVIVLYNSKKDKIFLLYKLYKLNNNLNAIVLCCKNEVKEILRLEKIIKNNFENAYIVFVHSCACSKATFGNISILPSSLFVKNKCQLNPIGQINISIFNNCYQLKSYLTKMQNIKILNAIYEIIINAYSIS